MKKFFAAVCFLFLIFSIWAEEKVIEIPDIKFQHQDIFDAAMSSTAWTDRYGPVSLEEKLFSERLGLVSAAVNYDSSLDNGSWIDEIFAEDSTFVVTKPKMLEEVDETLSTLEVESEDADIELKEIEKVVEENRKEAEESPSTEISRHVKDSEERLAYFSYGEEVITVNTKDLDRTFVYSDKKKIIRKSFDAKMNLVKKETWKKSNSSDVSPETVQTFVYGEGTKPLSSTVLSSDAKTELKYNESGKIIHSENYKLYKKDDKSKGRFYKDSVTDWKYNDSGRILEKESIQYDYNKIYTTVTGKSQKKEEYQYKVSESVPDYFYYEDKVLRLSTVYSSEESYVTTMNFEGGFVIESYYENGKRLKDIYYLNGIVRRTRNYE